MYLSGIHNLHKGMDPHFHGDDKKKMGVREEVDSASKKSRKN